jgi:hypothetical protein
MPANPFRNLLNRIRNQFDPSGDALLLDRFALANDQAAFAALVSRHGSLVWGVCLRVAFAAFDGEDGQSVSVAFSPDGSRLAGASFGACVTLRAGGASSH